jgi:hypothetical protein
MTEPKVYEAEFLLSVVTRRATQIAKTAPRLTKTKDWVMNARYLVASELRRPWMTRRPTKSPTSLPSVTSYCEAGQAG